MKYLNHPVELITLNEMRLLHQKTLELLEAPGIHIDHPGFLDALEAKGATIDRSKRVARLPPALTEMAVNATVHSPCLLKDDWRAVSEVEAAGLKAQLDSPLCFAFGGSSQEVVNTDGHTTRPGRHKDLESIVRFGNGHPRIKSVGGPPLLFTVDEKEQAVPPNLMEMSGMVYMAKHSTKWGWNGVNTIQDLHFAVRLGELLRGGKEAYRKTPIFLVHTCSATPLGIGRKIADVLYEMVRLEVPSGLLPMPLAGGTVPLTPASAMLVANAEILASMAMIWAAGHVSDRAHGMVSGIIDMQTTGASFASPNAVLQDAALAQLYRRFYGLEFLDASDYIDAKSPGYQSGSERALKIATMAACGVIFPSIGQLRAGMVCSPEQACLDIEAFDWIQHFMRGVEVSEDSAANF